MVARPADLPARAAQAANMPQTHDLISSAKYERLMLPTGAIRAEAQRWWHAELPVQLPARLQTLLMHAAPGSAAKVKGLGLPVFPNVHVCNRRCSRMLVGAPSTRRCGQKVQNNV